MAVPLWARAKHSYLSRLTTTINLLWTAKSCGAATTVLWPLGASAHLGCYSGKRLSNFSSLFTYWLYLLIRLFWCCVPSGDPTHGEIFGNGSVSLWTGNGNPQPAGEVGTASAFPLLGSFARLALFLLIYPSLRPSSFRISLPTCSYKFWCTLMRPFYNLMCCCFLSSLARSHFYSCYCIFFPKPKQLHLLVIRSYSVFPG